MPTMTATLLLLLASVSSPAASEKAEPRRPEAPIQTTLPGPAVSVPMDTWGGRPIVEVRINGEGPFRLILDTGTGFPLVLDEGTVTKLKLPVTGTTPLPTNAEAEDLDSIQVDSLTIGEAEFSSIRGIRSGPRGCGAMMGEGIHGILGLPLFENCLLTLDFPKHRVQLESGELPPPNGETIEYSGEEDGDYGVTVTLSAAGVPVKAHLDTGSPALVTLLNKMQEKLPLTGKPRIAGMARTPQGKAEVRSATLDGTLTLGRHEWTKPRIDFADLGPMLDYDAGNIGSRLLKDFEVTVDQKNHRVRFRRGGGG